MAFFFFMIVISIFMQVGITTGVLVIAGGVLSLMSAGSLVYLLILYFDGEEFPRQVVAFASCLPMFLIFMFFAERREYFVSRLRNVPVYVYFLLALPLAYYAYWQYASRQVEQYNQAIWELVGPSYDCFTYESEWITPIQSVRRSILTSECHWAEKWINRKIEEMGPIEQMPTSNAVILVLLTLLIGGVATVLGGFMSQSKSAAARN